MYISRDKIISTYLRDKKNRLKYILILNILFMVSFSSTQLIYIFFIAVRLRLKYACLARESALGYSRSLTYLNFRKQFPASSSRGLTKERCVRRAGQSFSRSLGHNGSITNTIVIGSSCPWPHADDVFQKLNLSIIHWPFECDAKAAYLFIRSRRGRDIIYNVTYYALSFASFFNFFHFALDVIQRVASKQFF